MLRTFFSIGVAAALLLTCGAPAANALTSLESCVGGKHLAAASHVLCVLKARAKSIRKGEPADTARCDTKLASNVGKADARFGAACPTVGDDSEIAARSENLADALELLVATPTPTSRAAFQCATAKLRVASKRAACGSRHKRVELRRGALTRDVTRCDERIAAIFAKAEARAAGACPSTGDASAAALEAENWFHEVEADLDARDSVAFAANGPFRVSSRRETFVDTTRGTDANNGFPALAERTLEARVWYPVVTPGLSAPVLDAGGPFPLVIRAHGFGGFADDSGDITSHLASYGYVVVAPTFPLSNFNTPGGATLADVDEQIADISFLIDEMLARSATAGSLFEGGIDASRVGAVGHSLGGITVLGAGYHTDIADPRIGAVVGHAPLGCVLEDGFFDGGTAALMIVGGTEDLVTRYPSNHLAPYQIANAEKYLVTLEGGLHVGFITDFLNDDSQNGDDILGCALVVPPGESRPFSGDFGLPIDYLGGAAAGIDPTGGSCEAVCPAPGPTWMAHDRQIDLAQAATVAMFESTFRDDFAAKRLLDGALDTENSDLTLLSEQ
ncbi:MAG: dienelactone hydrolase [Hyphomicrobiaceae bacterium]|jgi:dienelactone hydrolase